LERTVGVVAVKPRYFAELLIGTVAVATIAAPPLAVADPMVGDGPADSTIAALKAEGYNVAINWVNGFDTEPLSQCLVTAINNPNDSTTAPATFTTVYVDVSCPNHPD
jgi:hypothetical protein